MTNDDTLNATDDSDGATLDESLELEFEPPELWVEVEPSKYPGFEVLIRYVDAKQLADIDKQCERKLNRRERLAAGGQVVRDEEKRGRMLVRYMTRKWRNFRVEHLRNIAPISDKSEREIRERFGGVVPFSARLLDQLVDHSYYNEFVEMIQAYALNLEQMRQAQEAVRVKNSEGSPAS